MTRGNKLNTAINEIKKLDKDASDLFIELYNKNCFNPDVCESLVELSTIYLFKRFFTSQLRNTENRIINIIDTEGKNNDTKAYFENIYRSIIRRKKELILSLNGDLFSDSRKLHIYEHIIRRLDFMLLGNIWLIDGLDEGTKKEYFSHVNNIFSLDIECGIEFARMSLRLLYSPEKYDIDELDIGLVGKYANAVKFLLEKSKIPGSGDYKPEGLLNRLLDYRNEDLIIEALQSPVFLNYVYEGRLPAYSWSARSGEEMMKALTTGEYEKSYKAEVELIKNVNKS